MTIRMIWAARGPASVSSEARATARSFSKGVFPGCDAATASTPSAPRTMTAVNRAALSGKRR
jgi:hypothetical protein